MDEALIQEQERQLQKTRRYYKHVFWLCVPLLCMACYFYGARPLLLCGIALYITCGARPSLSIFFSLLHWRSSLPAFVFSNPVKAQYSLQVIMECSFR